MVQQQSRVTLEQLRGAAKARPFVPFRLILLTGPSLKIDRPGFLFVPPFPSAMLLALAHEDGTIGFVDSRNIAEIQFEHAA